MTSFRRLAPLVTFAFSLGAMLLAVACGGDGGNRTVASAGTVAAQTVAAGGTPSLSNRTPSTGGTEGGPQPLLPAPAARFTLQLESLTDNQYIVDEPETYILTAEQFAASALFQSAEQGDSLTKEWGFQEGYTVQFDPDGFLAGVLAGGYYLTVESYLFETVEGAIAAFKRFDTTYEAAVDSVRIDTAPLGNESSAFSIAFGNVGRSNMGNIYHRFIWRRGNLISVVQTNGGTPFMSIDIARDYAVIIDDQALGKRPAVLPTPQSR